MSVSSYNVVSAHGLLQHNGEIMNARDKLEREFFFGAIVFKHFGFSIGGTKF